MSLAIDESTDFSHVAQLCIFVLLGSSDFNITEELLDVAPLEWQTRGIDIYKLTMDTLDKYECPFGNLLCRYKWGTINDWYSHRICNFVQK